MILSASLFTAWTFDCNASSRLVGRAAIDGILEVYNVFNHANYGSYTTSENNVAYGKPSSNTNVAYAPRMLQLGFRVTY